MVTFAAGSTLLVMLVLRRKQLPKRVLTPLLVLSLVLLAGSIGLWVLMNATVVTSNLSPKGIERD